MPGPVETRIVAPMARAPDQSLLIYSIAEELQSFQTTGDWNRTRGLEQV